MYAYENHLGGGLYLLDYELEYEDLYCEQCGDSDWLVDEVNTMEELESLLEYYNYSDEEKKEFIENNWEGD